MGQQSNKNQYCIMLILTMLAILLPYLIPQGIVYQRSTQPNVVYESLPVYRINTSEDADIKSVLAVSLKNTGHSPAENVHLVIYSDINDTKKFYQDKNEIIPDDSKTFIHVKAEPNPFRMVYTLDEFAPHTDFIISIATPYKEPEVKIKGSWEGGNKIKEEKNPPVYRLTELWFYSFGLLSCFLVTKFLIPRIRRIRKGASPLNKLRVFREMHDLTQEDLAERVGVTRETINAIENRRCNPPLKLAFKLAKVFEVNIEDIFISNR